jgi:hypothetical protein
MSQLELEIQQHVIQYLAGSMSLADFENWLVPVLWDIDMEDSDTQEMAGTVHILLSELSRGDRTVDAFREGLARTTRKSGTNSVVQLASSYVAQSNGRHEQVSCAA